MTSLQCCKKKKAMWRKPYQFSKVNRLFVTMNSDRANNSRVIIWQGCVDMCKEMLSYHSWHKNVYCIPTTELASGVMEFGNKSARSNLDRLAMESRVVRSLEAYQSIRCWCCVHIPRSEDQESNSVNTKKTTHHEMDVYARRRTLCLGT